MSLQDELSQALSNVDEITYRTRINICKMCPALNTLNVCKDCLCFMNVKAKLKSQSCPRNKWK